MIVFLLGLSIFLHMSDAYVMRRHLRQAEEEDPKSITMFISGQDNPETRRHATGQARHDVTDKRHRKRNSEDVLEDLYNNAPESGKQKQHGGSEMRSKNHKQQHKNHKQQDKPNEMDISKIVNGVANYISKSPIVHSARSGQEGGGETKIDLVKLVNGAFSYLANFNPTNRANNKRSTHLDPRPIELRSKYETSLLYEINTKSIVEDVSNLLSSKNINGFVDSMARKAATIYRAVTKDD